MTETPVLLLVFNRPDLTARMMDVLRRVQPRRLYIAADGHRAHIAGEDRACAETRAIALATDWPCEVQTLFRPGNLGCGPAVSSAITWFFEQEDRGIILEDDCIPAEHFFSFCEVLLERYADNEQVMMIGGLGILDKPGQYPHDYFFSPFSSIWGWASWARAWKQYKLHIADADLSVFDRIQNPVLRNSLVGTLHGVQAGRVNTWDIQWVYAILRSGGICINPFRNMIRNIGFTGTHSNRHISRSQDLPHEYLDTRHLDHPASTATDPRVEALYEKQLQRILENDSQVPALQRVRRLLITHLRKLFNNHAQPT